MEKDLEKEKDMKKHESVWSHLNSITESSSFDSLWERALLEAQKEEFQDYETDIHPYVQQKRDELRKALKWVADGLRASQYSEMTPLADRLEQIPDLPSERLMQAMQQLSGELHKSKSELRKFVKGAPDKEHKDAIEGALKTIEGALMGLPSMMKSAAAVTTSSKSDKALWQKKVSGHVDKETGEFIRRGTIVHPTGQAPMKAADKRAKADAEVEKEKQKQISKTIAPKIRKKEAVELLLQSIFESAVAEEDDVDVHAKNVHIDLSPHEHDDVYEAKEEDEGPEEDESEKLAPEFEKLVKKFAQKISGEEDVGSLQDMLRDFAKEMEEAEGEGEEDILPDGHDDEGESVEMDAQEE